MNYIRKVGLLTALLLAVISSVTFAKDRIVVSNVALTSTNINSIPNTNNSVTTLPNFTVTSGYPAYVYDYGTKWQVKEGNQWNDVTQGNFLPNKTYRLSIYIVINNAVGSGSPSATAGSDYQLANDGSLKVTLNGNTLTTDSVVSFDMFDEYSVCAFSEPISLDSREVISTISLTSSNINKIPQTSNSVQKEPTIEVTTGFPAYIPPHYTYWQILDGEVWLNAQNGNFVSGETYRLVTSLFINNDTENGSPSSTANDDYLLSENNLTVTLNDEPMTISYYSANSDCSNVIVYSKPYVAHITVPRQIIVNISATSNDIDSIPRSYNSVDLLPTFTVTEGSPAYFYITENNTYWQIYNGTGWDIVSETNFIPGRTYRLVTQIWVDNDVGSGSPSATAGDEYVLYNNANALSIRLNGEYMTVDEITIDDEYSCAIVISKVYTVGTSREVISTITAVSDDIDDIPNVNNSVSTVPTITITSGEPAYFYIDPYTTFWEVQDGDSWSQAEEGNFIDGRTYRLVASIWVDNDIDAGSPSVNAGYDYMLDEDNLVVTLNGSPMTFDEVCVEDEYSNVIVRSKSYTVGSNNFIVGDLDRNGKIEIIDVRLLLQAFINSSSQTEWAEADLDIMDLNGDRKIDIIDVRLLLQLFINT